MLQDQQQLLKSIKAIEIRLNFVNDGLGSYSVKHSKYHLSLEKFQTVAPILWKVIRKRLLTEGKLTTLNAAICLSCGRKR